VERANRRRHRKSSHSENRVLSDKDTLADIEEISLRPKYLEQLVEFRELFEDIGHQLSALESGSIHSEDVALSCSNKCFNRISRLRVLLARNQHGVDSSAITKAIAYLHALNSPSDISDALAKLPHKEQFQALSLTLNGITGVQDFLDNLDEDPIAID